METNVIYCGDCRDVLKSEIPQDSIDLIYLDPPFFSNKKYEVIWGNGAELRSFEDRWKGGINHYIEWMEERLESCRSTLKNTGSIYAHCDWRASHYIRMSLDRVFGYDNFKNEIIWHFGLGGGPRNHWNRKHNNIYFYTKSKDFAFNMQYVPATSQRMKGMNKKMDDVWDIPSINNMSHERLGYPTQKPEALIERIIVASSNPDDIVLDPFCGCGTTIAVANSLNRRWIGIDVSPIACNVMKKRMEDLEGVADVKIEGLPVSPEDLEKYDPFKFQDYICKKLKGKPAERKSSDMGIDGYLLEDNTPIQVKQSKRVGRNVIDNFETAIKRKRKRTGIVAAFSFTRGSYEEVARIKKDEGLEIKLVQIKDLVSL